MNISRSQLLRFQAPRGTVDILPDEQVYWRFFQSKANEVATKFGYDLIETPVFEDTGLFVRGIGEATDIVEKETYTFQDRGGDSLTLRPEGTAPVCRAYLEHGMHNLPQPVRLHYICPVFRYERPQSGRYRQHHQFGVEVFGEEDASIDAEVIELSWALLHELGIKKLSLSINSIGDPKCRPGYVDNLKAYYHGNESRLCVDCKRRLDRNPLRLLDCKDEGCQDLIIKAPRSVEYLCNSCEQHWICLLDYLRELHLPYEIDHRLVRGFDYYTRTVFEIVPPIEGRQSALVGGGRYDGLIEELGGKHVPGIGFGMGIERVLVNLKRQDVIVPSLGATKILVAYMGEHAKLEAIRLCASLRSKNVITVMGPTGRNLRSQLRYASSIGASHAVIVGEDEIKKGVFTVRNLVKSEQLEVPLSELFGMFS